MIKFDFDLIRLKFYEYMIRKVVYFDWKCLYERDIKIRCEYRLDSLNLMKE